MNQQAHLTDQAGETVVPVLQGEKILIGTSSFASLDSTPMDILKRSGATIIDNPFKRRLTKDELLALLKDGITGLIAGLEPLDREVLSQSELKVLSRCGSGMSNVDQQAAEELGIAVRSTPNAPVASVAELTLAAMLDLLRMVSCMNQEMHAGTWKKRIGGLLRGKTVVIIGFGRIGRKVASLLNAFGVKLLVVDPFVTDVDNVQVLSLEEALPQADIITIHCSDEKCILGSEEMKLLKSGAFLLNGARGAVVDEKALLKALDDGRVAGMWSDVFIEEPYNGPLLKYDQVLLTPHIGSYTRECRLQMETETVENLIEAFAKQTQ